MVHEGYVITDRACVNVEINESRKQRRVAQIDYLFGVATKISSRTHRGDAVSNHENGLIVVKSVAVEHGLGNKGPSIAFLG